MLQVGIVGLPNAGKSTLFNALASRRLAETDIRPFTTIEPYEAVASVPDKDFEKLCDLIKPEKCVPADITFIDIAGLVKDAHKGEGLGNQFLGKIREVDAIVHVVRAFKDEGVAHQHATHDPGSEKQILEDVEVVNIELELADIKNKPTIYVLNKDEETLTDDISLYHTKVSKKFGGEVVSICAKLEEELIDLEEAERVQYLKESKIKETGLAKLIIKSYSLLDLISFYTVKPSSAKATEGQGGGNQVTAWSIGRGRGSTAIEAAEKVHTDFAKKFIKTEVINVDELLRVGGWKLAREKGKLRLEGKDYVVQDGDVIEFKVGN